MTMAEKVLVTGGAGFIGSHLVRRLLDEGYQVICLDNFDPYYDPLIKRKNIAEFMRVDKFQLVEGDIRDGDLLKKIFAGNDIKYLLHLAAKAGVRTSIEYALDYADVNVRGTVTLLEVAKDHGVEKFVFGSSSSVYGCRSFGEKFKEDDPIVYPISPYAASKVAGEAYCYTYHYLYKIPMVILRFFTVYGPGQRPEMAIHKFARLIDEGQEIPLYGDGSAKRDFTYVEDIVDGIARAMRAELEFEVFNLAGGRTYEIIEVVRGLEAELGKEAKIRFLPTQPGDVPVTEADISKARTLLGYEPKTPLQEGLRKFVEWYREVARKG